MNLNVQYLGDNMSIFDGRQIIPSPSGGMKLFLAVLGCVGSSFASLDFNNFDWQTERTAREWRQVADNFYQQYTVNEGKLEHLRKAALQAEAMGMTHSPKEEELAACESMGKTLNFTIQKVRLIDVDSMLDFYLLDDGLKEKYLDLFRGDLTDFQKIVQSYPWPFLENSSEEFKNSVLHSLTSNLENPVHRAIVTLLMVVHKEKTNTPSQLIYRNKSTVLEQLGLPENFNSSLLDNGLLVFAQKPENGTTKLVDHCILLDSQRNPIRFVYHDQQSKSIKSRLDYVAFDHESGHFLLKAFCHLAPWNSLSRIGFHLFEVSSSVDISQMDDWDKSPLAQFLFTDSDELLEITGLGSFRTPKEEFLVINLLSERAVSYASGKPSRFLHCDACSWMGFGAIQVEFGGKKQRIFDIISQSRPKIYDDLDRLISLSTGVTWNG